VGEAGTGRQRRWHALLVASALVAGTTLAVSAPSGASAAGTAPAEPGVDPTHLLVRVDGTPAQIEARVERAGGDVEQTITGTDWVVVETDRGALDRTARALDADAAVEDVEYNRRREIAALPDDPLYPSFQAAYLAPLHVDAAWDRTKGAGVTIAVLDTGVDLDHPDLAGRIVPGIDIRNEDADPTDDHGHGTAVAGTAAATVDNGIGIAGVAGEASIMPVKVLSASGSGFDADIASGIVWATDHGADVINLSLGGPGASAVLADAVDYARDHDVVVLAAAGNSGTAEPTYPAALDDAIAVGATDASGNAAWFSTRGWWVDVAAPGIRIATTSMGAGASYATTSGTSLATPIAAGIVALMRADDPAATASELTDRLLASSRDRGPHGIDPVYGFGIVDARAALGGPAPADEPTIASDAGEPNDTADRATFVASTGIGSISPEGDEDWYAFDAAPGAYTISVVPPTDGGASTARRFDPTVTVFSPQYQSFGNNETAGTADIAQTQTTAISVPSSGRYLVRVANDASSTSPGPYVLTIAPGSSGAPLTASRLALRDTTPPNNARDVDPTTPVSLRFTGSVDVTSLNDATVQFVDAQTGAVVPTTRALQSATVLTLTPGVSLAERPYVVRVRGVRLANGTTIEDVAFRFTVGPHPATSVEPPALTQVPTPSPTPSPSPTPPPATVSAPAPSASGYWMVEAGGAVHAFGASYYGRATVFAVDIESTPSGAGYWIVSATGEVRGFGDAVVRGSLPAGVLASGETITSMSADPSGGYWLFTTRGRVFAFGAAFFGDLSRARLNAPILDSVATPSGRGYYMVAADGGVFAFGDAVFRGSMGGRRLNAAVQSLVPDPDGQGYWLVALDGGVFAFDAPFRGSMGAQRLNQPVTGMVSYGNGYLMVATDGGIFSFSDRPFAGSLGGTPPAVPVVAVAATR
jgi:subtilisin family serine protease